MAITGASRGLGAGMAREMHRRGLRLALCARGEPVLSGEPGVLAERLDICDERAVEAFAARAERELGPIDLWINNAGVLEPIGPLRDTAAVDFWSHQQVNLLGVFLGTRAYVRQVRARPGGGVLVNISSGAARRPYAGWSAYCAAKAAVDRLTECVQLEEREAGLRAHAVAPGVIDTDMQAQIRACDPARFPEVDRFRALRRSGGFSSAAFVASELLALAFGPARDPEHVLVRLPAPGQTPAPAESPPGGRP